MVSNLKIISYDCVKIVNNDDDDIGAHLIWIDEDVNSRGQCKKKVAELDHDSTPQWLVWKLTVTRDDENTISKINPRRWWWNYDEIVLKLWRFWWLWWYDAPQQ